MIPKIIHYCWFRRNPIPAEYKRYIESWKKFLPDYEIKEWNEDNFDVNIIPFTKEAYEVKKYAYVSDYARLKILYDNGGVYFDTDVEVIRYPQELIESYQAWFGFELAEYVNTGLGFGAIPHHPAVQAMVHKYDNLQTIVGCPQLNTETLVERGLVCNGKKQQVAEAIVLPIDYLCPLNDATGILNKSTNTVSIHWFAKSPHGKIAFYRSKLTRIYHRICLRFRV